MVKGITYICVKRHGKPLKFYTPIQQHNNRACRHGNHGGLITQATYHFIQISTHLPGQNGRHFTDDIFSCIFVNEKFCILIKISLKFVPEGPIDNDPALI